MGEQVSFLQDEIKHCCRELIRQDCETLEIEVLKGVVSSYHIHMHIEYPAKHSISEIMKQFKGRSSRLLQKEIPSLKKRYWGQHLWATGYDGVWSTGNITDEMVQEYLEHHRKPPDSFQNNLLPE